MCLAARVKSGSYQIVAASARRTPCPGRRALPQQEGATRASVWAGWQVELLGRGQGVPTAGGEAHVPRRAGSSREYGGGESRMTKGVLMSSKLWGRPGGGGGQGVVVGKECGWRVEATMAAY